MWDPQDFVLRLATLDSLVPIGTILVYTGPLNTLDDHWLPCDGTLVTTEGSPLKGKHTPDLRGLFLRGIEDYSEAPGDTAGVDHVVAHGHPHKHSFEMGLNTVDPRPLSVNGQGGFYIDAATSPEALRHSHSGVSDMSNVAAGGHDNRPHFMSIYLIMRVL
jgi:hypothetical protein